MLLVDTDDHYDNSNFYFDLSGVHIPTLLHLRYAFIREVNLRSYSIVADQDQASIKSGLQSWYEQRKIEGHISWWAFVSISTQISDQAASLHHHCSLGKTHDLVSCAILDSIIISIASPFSPPPIASLYYSVGYTRLGRLWCSFNVPE